MTSSLPFAVTLIELSRPAIGAGTWPLFFAAAI